MNFFALQNSTDEYLQVNIYRKNFDCPHFDGEPRVQESQQV